MKPAQALDLVDENDPAPSTHVWCPGCADVRPYRTTLVHPTSRRNRTGFEANHMVCCGCSSVVATVYLKAEENLAA